MFERPLPGTGEPSAARAQDPVEVPQDPGDPTLVRIPLHDHGTLLADLTVPASPLGLVLFAHGSGSGRKSLRNRSVAAQLHRARWGTLLLDLLTPDEAREDDRSGTFRFDIPLLSERLLRAIDWVQTQPRLARLPLSLYGASTGGSAALLAAARRPDRIVALVLRGARTDLAEQAAERVQAPTLVLVGERDPEILEMGRRVLPHLPATSRLVVVSGATHLFEEPGAMGEVSRATVAWVAQHRERGTPETA